jgi:hypothetical protein
MKKLLVGGVAAVALMAGTQSTPPISASRDIGQGGPHEKAGV